MRNSAGGLGVHWALCAASLHRKEMLEWIETLRRATTMILIFVFMLIVMLVTSQEKTLDPAVPLAMLLELVSLAIFPYLEHVQATVLGSLVGMSMPFLAGGTVGARLWAALGFLGLQFGVILATLVSVVLAAPRLPPAISPLVFGLLAFCLIREAARDRPLARPGPSPGHRPSPHQTGAGLAARDKTLALGQTKNRARGPVTVQNQDQTKKTGTWPGHRPRSGPNKKNRARGPVTV